MAHRPIAVGAHRTARRCARPAALALGAALLLLGGCGADEEAAGDGDSDPRSETSGPAAEDLVDLTGQDAVTIQARDNTFTGQHVLVSAGTEVTFDNRGRNPHNAIPVTDGAFTEVPTEDLQPGDQVAVTFDEPGDYPYYCSLHGTESAGMTGTIRVEP